jgi:hypothetical protein
MQLFYCCLYLEYLYLDLLEFEINYNYYNYNYKKQTLMVVIYSTVNPQYSATGHCNLWWYIKGSGKQKYCVIQNFCSQTVMGTICEVDCKGKGIPLQAWEGSWVSRRLRLLDLLSLHLNAILLGVFSFRLFLFLVLNSVSILPSVRTGIYILFRQL